MAHCGAEARHRLSRSSRVWLAVVLGMALPLPAAASEYSAARKVGDVNTRVMGCPDDAFWDPRNGGECWSCGAGQRTANPVTSARACLVPPRTSFQPAQRLQADKTRCPDGSFLDVGKGSCWSCPSGTSRTAFAVDGGKACSRRVARKRTTAKFVYKTSSLLKPCRRGTFANVGSRSCYTCPSGWKHDPSRKVKAKGVCYQPARTEHVAARKTRDLSLRCATGFYDPIDGGSCWQCPSGYTRQVSSVKSDRACVRISEPQSTAARKISDRSPTFEQVTAGVSDLGCGAYGRNAFFDLKDGGTCWTCPASHPQRTLHAVDTPRACATKACGRENGRPCSLWERVPSCNAGLVEDPIEGRCVPPRNLACNAYVSTLKGLRNVVLEAQARGGAAAEQALARIPGAKAFLRFALNQMAVVQAAADSATPQLDYGRIVEPFTQFLQANPEFVANYLRTVTIAAEKQDRFTEMMLDADLMCGGDLNRIAQRFADTGLHDAFLPVEPDPGPTVIRMSRLGGLGSLPAMGASFGSLEPEASPVVGPGSRNRLILDFSLDISGDLLGVKGFKGTFSPGLQLAIALDSLAEGDHGLYLVFGGYAGGAQETPDSIDQLVEDGLGAVHFSVGLQLGGPARHADHACHTGGTVSGGFAIKTKYVGFGFNPTCPLGAVFTGFNIDVGAMNLGELRTFTQTVGALATPAGAVSVAQPPWTQPRFSRAYPTRQLLGGGEIAIRLLPREGQSRIGSVF